MKKIAFLRGINVSGKNKIHMAELKSICVNLGWQSVKTCLQTGNVIFSAHGSKTKLEKDLEAAIESHCGFIIPVVVRNSDDFTSLLDESPLAEQAAKTPSQVLLYLTKKSIHQAALDYLNERAAASEEIYIHDDSLWVHFPSGVGSSKLTPVVLDRAVGSVATGRNWNTAKKIQSICSQL